MLPVIRSGDNISGKWSTANCSPPRAHDDIIVETMMSSCALESPHPPPLAPPPGGCSSNGLTREELHASLATVQSLAAICEADMMVLREKPVEGRHMAECLVRRRVEEDDFLEVR